ncbi:MAG: septum formation initiator family protein [Syntrophomonadaceae bacterium]|nr:septum formation initiator family protein [Syntrophomonadaceae bacterium]
MTSDGRPGAGRTRSKLRFKRVMLLGVLVILAVTFGPRLQSIWEMHCQIEKLEAQKAALQKRNAELRQMEKKLKTDEMVEKLAREELGMIKPGEKVIVKVLPTRPE